MLRFAAVVSRSWVRSNLLCYRKTISCLSGLQSSPHTVTSQSSCHLYHYSNHNVNDINVQNSKPNLAKLYMMFIFSLVGYSLGYLSQDGECESPKKDSMNSSDPPEPENTSVNSGSRRARFNFIAAVVKEVVPAVVFIEIKTDLRKSLSYIGIHGNEHSISSGSGFLIKEDGLILTNAHVVTGHPNAVIQVTLQDGRKFHGRLESMDTNSDLATVRIPCKELPSLKLGSSSSVMPGEWVVAVGSPLSLTNTITTGVVSSVSRGSVELGLRGKEDMEYIQTDAAITFGNSGGPLINLDGEVIGINCMKVAAGISFAIPIDYVKHFLATVTHEGDKRDGPNFSNKSRGKKKDPTQRPYLGVTLLTLTPQLILELQMRGAELPPNVLNGVLVWKTVLGSPAHSGGIQPGDIIVAINGEMIHCSQDVYESLLRITDGNKAKVSVVRKGQKLDLLVCLQ